MFSKLKGKRVEKGITQRELAKRIGITNMAYSNKETGKTPFNYYEIVKILEILDCKFEDIFI